MKFPIFLSVMFILGSRDTTSSTLMSKFREHQQYPPPIKDQQQPTRWTGPHMIQDILASIDDKLRSLDTFSNTLKLSRLDYSVEQLVRRLENIETKLSRMETKFDVRMSKIEEVVIGKDIKEEFTNEHLVRRIENLNDKFNTKMSFLEAKIDIRMDRLQNKLELLERDLHSSTEDISDRLVKADERQLSFQYEVLENLKRKEEKPEDELESKFHQKIEQTINRTVNCNKANAIESNVRTALEEIKEMYRARSSSLSDSRLRSILDDYGVVNVQTQKQIEDIMTNLTTIIHKTLNLNEAKFRELNTDIELYTRKIITSMENLYKSSDEVKTNLYDAVQQGNKTREIVRQEFNKLHQQIQPIPMLEPKLTDVSVNLNQKLSELGATVDNSFATLLIAQNTFIDTCRRIQQEENHIYQILEKVVYEMRNRSKFDVEKIVSNVRNHSDDMSRNLDEILFAVLTASNETVNRILEFLLSKQNIQVHHNGCRFQKARETAEKTADIEALAYSIPAGLNEHESFQHGAVDLPINPDLKHGNNSSSALDYDTDYTGLQEETDYTE